MHLETFFSNSFKKETSIKKGLLKPVLIILCLLFSINNVIAQPPKFHCSQFKAFKKTLDTFHYQPVEITAAVSDEIFEMFLEDLDANRMFLLKKDVEALSIHKADLHKIFNEENCALIKDAASLIGKRFQQVDSVITNVLKSPFNYTANDTLTFTPTQTLDFSEDLKEVERRWRKWLKYEMLVYLSSNIEGDLENAFKQKQFETTEEEIRKKLLIKEQRNIHKTLKHTTGLENYVASLLLNAIAKRYDPHTAYFSNETKESFEAALSVQSLSFGFSIDELDNGTIVIERLLSGSPAWNSNAIHKGDVLLKVKSTGTEFIDLTFSSIEEVGEIIGNATSQQINLVLKKASGAIDTVMLKKEMLKDDENLIKSHVFKGEKNIGYISLPDFYTEWDNITALGCANDVAKEIVKLKKDSIEALIIDLRFNGGGSVYEVINLIGIFINEGPVCINHSRGQKPTIQKDMNRGTMYDGPLVVMVNNFSASASEIFAGTMQDYNRAVIVGDNTFGKATGQVILPILPNPTIEAVVAASKKPNNLYGYLKVTTDCYFRVTSKTHQTIGVKPDVSLPDLFSYLEVSEGKMKYTLKHDTIDKKANFIPLASLPIKELVSNSTARVMNNESFKRISVVSDSLNKASKAEYKLPLNIVGFSKKYNENKKASINLENLLKSDNTKFTVRNNSFDYDLIQIDEYRKNINKIILEILQNDIYLEETFNIAIDLISQQKP